MEIFELIENKVKDILEEGEGVHDFDHTKRVFTLALKIGKMKDADLEILGLSALLHDIGRPEELKQNHETCHAEIGAEIAGKILENYRLDKEKIEKIKNCIRKHRFTKGEIPETIEEKILYDADKIDNIGAIGILRAANYSGTYHARTHNPEINAKNVNPFSKEDTAYQHYHIKLKKIKNKLFTDEAKRIAEDRHKFMEEFFNRVNLECEGKK